MESLESASAKFFFHACQATDTLLHAVQLSTQPMSLARRKAYFQASSLFSFRLFSFMSLTTEIMCWPLSASKTQMTFTLYWIPPRVLYANPRRNSIFHLLSSSKLMHTFRRILRFGQM